ncbi:MAG TPA: hypothetical protein PKK06_05430 [Phycisphaerae bacterium]|nr:hypothetical protein [Phycisphaerae bacterium]HNU44801.1 hypothetical protein [Phycisphaerae bacterium]
MLNTLQKRNHDYLIFLVVLLLPMLPVSASAEEVATASVLSPYPRADIAVPVPRSLDLAEAFPLERQAVLPALGPDDTVRHTENPPVIGRVFPQQLATACDGVWTQLKDGGRLWTLELASPNAESLRVRFEPFRPPLGAELILYNADDAREAYGPFTAADAHAGFPFWAPTVFGRRVRVEYYLPSAVDPASPRAALTITGILQNFPMPRELLERSGCRLDASCYPGWETEMAAVAHIRFVEGGESYVCSGAMVTRTVADFDPLFLTAGHCVSSDEVAATVEVYWLFQSETCDGSVPPLGSVPRTNWSTHLTTDSDADCTLLGLNAAEIPGDIAWAGWSSGEAPNPSLASMIHHPLGMRKSYSWGTLLGIEDISQCFGTAYDTYDFELLDGGQDGGSSGAPVFTQSDHLIRAVATCSESDECIPDEDTGEGALCYAFDRLSEYLAARSVVYVWRNTPCDPADEDGSLTCPWNSLLEGYYGVLGGGTIVIFGGTYPPMTFDGVRGMTVQAHSGTVVIGE